MTSPLFSGLSTIRGKLTVASVLPLVLILFLVALAASFLMNASIVDQTLKQIRNDLKAARVILEQEQLRINEAVRFTAQSLTLIGALQTGDREALKELLRQTREQARLDILDIVGPGGEMLLQPGDNTVSDFTTLVTSSLSKGPVQGIAVLSEEQLELESPELARRARIYRSSGGNHPLEKRGMFLIAAVPLYNQAGDAIGSLYGGLMLNNNLHLVDRINELVYDKDEYAGISVGSATIFLGNLRIATTIRLENGERAIGTHISPQVAEAVFLRREIWHDRALVVNNWYLTAYEPINDIKGEVVGALYVGMLEMPFIALKKRAFGTLFGLTLLGCLLGSLLAGWFARDLSKPILALAKSAERIASGEREMSLPKAGNDEIGHLTAAFGDMTRALRKSDHELQELNRELEEKVARRTSQLEEKSLQLIETQEKLLRQEKLAAIGSLATGVAHEINNPAAIIRGNVEILQMSLAADASEREEAAEIMKQVERISRITQNLLNFSREQNIKPQPVDLPALLDEILEQLSHQVEISEITVSTHFAADLPAVEGDYERLQQVFTNILLNAAQAMEGKGTLHLSGSVHDDWIQIRIADSGPGMDKAIQKKIFNPFFTTKNTGTGLGLSVSYGIVRAHGGLISVSSPEGHGAVFQVDLPLRQSTVG